MSPIPLGILAAAGASVPLANSFDLLQTADISSLTTSVTFSNLVSTYGADYQHLEIRIVGRTDRGGANQDSNKLNINGQTANHRSHRMTFDGSTLESSFRGSDPYIYFGQTAATDSSAGAFGTNIASILDPFSTTKNTTVMASTSVLAEGTGGGTGTYMYFVSGLYISTDAVDQLQISAITGQYVAGSRISLYGIKAAA